MAEKKIKTFGNGVPYVEAGEWAKLLAWLVDFVMFVLFGAIGFVIVAVIGSAVGLDDDQTGLIALAALVVAPLLYGLFYTNGRALGGLFTGTRLVRIRDGGRIGAKGPWAMVVRTILLPLLIAAMVFGGGGVDGSLARTSIDMKRTRRLHASGYPGNPPGEGLDGGARARAAR